MGPRATVNALAPLRPRLPKLPSLSPSRPCLGRAPGGAGPVGGRQAGPRRPGVALGRLQGCADAPPVVGSVAWPAQGPDLRPQAGDVRLQAKHVRNQSPLGLK